MQLIDFIETIGASRRDVENWQARIPTMGRFATLYAPTRRGLPRNYSKENVIELAFIAAFVRLGCDLGKANAFAGGLMRQYQTGKIRAWLVFPAPDYDSAISTDAPSNSEKIAAMSRISTVVNIHVAEIVRKVDELFDAHGEVPNA